MTDIARFESEGYFSIRLLPDNRLAGIMPFLFTFGLVVGLDDTGYQGRYCYEHLTDAAKALANWDGIGDPSGPWIKYKGKGGERLGPGAGYVGDHNG
jgi:hypothetical protein